MTFHSVVEAVRALEDFSAGPAVHMEAIRFLSGLDECDEARSLVGVLQSEDLGVRWEAGNLLARMGQKAVPAILRALTDPKQAGHSRLRESVMHVIHNFPESEMRQELDPLVKAMKGPSPNTETMRVAHRLLRKVDPDACTDENEVEPSL